MEHFVKQDFSGRHSEQGPYLRNQQKATVIINHIKNGQPEISG